MKSKCLIVVLLLLSFNSLAQYSALTDNRLIQLDDYVTTNRWDLPRDQWLFVQQFDDIPGTLWINEINVGDVIYDENYAVVHGIRENAYIEIAVPDGMDLGGWQIDFVTKSDYQTHTMVIPYGLPSPHSVTNGYAFFVICDSIRPNSQAPALPKVDFAYAGLSGFLPRYTPAGIRLRRPDGTCEQAIAYDDATYNMFGQAYDGRIWAANDPEGRFVYVGADQNNGSLSRVEVDDSTNGWVYPLFPEWGHHHENFVKNYTPGLPNGAQDLAHDLSSSEYEFPVVPLGALAYSGGSGTEEDPYQIATKADLLYLGTNTADYARDFILTADIDLAGVEFTNAVIAADADADTYGFQGDAFVGVFDGKGHVISNLTINTDGSSNDYLGLFGCLSGFGATVRSLRVENVNIQCGASEYVGVVCAYNHLGVVSSCTSSGSISCGAGADSVGGLCGINSQGGVNESSSAVSLSVAGNASRFGGLTGFNYYGAISNCLASGAVTSSGYYMGGLCGEIFGGVIVDSYASGTVSGAGYTGGLIGLNYYGGSVEGCFWDVDASGCPVSDGGTGLSTDEMKNQEVLIFAGWDFVVESSNGSSDYWYMDGYGYPKLAALNYGHGYFRLNIEGRSEVFVSDGLIVDLEAEPAPEGYLFDRWVVQPDAFSNSVDNILSGSAIFAMPATNIMLNAGYRVKRYVVNFDLAGHGSRSCGGELSQLIAHGDDAAAPVVSADEHWIFTGWDSAFTNITEELNVTAEYIAVEYELHLNSGVGGGFYAYQALVAVLADEPQEAQFFSHWTTDPSVFTNQITELTSPVTTFEMPGTNVILTAIYDSLFGGGEGTVEQPWQIGTKQHLINMALNTDYYNRNFVLSGDIDLNGVMFDRAVIAPDIDAGNGFQGVPFIGVFDGNGYVISNFTVSAGLTGYDYLGLFGCLSGGECEVHSLGVEGFEIIGGDFTLFAGGICGYNSGSRIRECYSSGSLRGSGIYLWYMGGVCGYNFGGEVTQCYSSGSVMGGIDSDFIGGLCGYNDGLIAECYSATFVETDSFAYYVSGFCGRDSASGVVTACFWDVENSGMVASAGATGKTTAEMEAQSTFVAMNWDFANIWYMEVYPALRCFNSPGTYSYWLMNNPGIPAALRAVSDIPVSDGVPNLIKYACGLPAMDACTTADLMSIERGSSNTFSVLYYKSKTAGDVILQPVWAETLYGPWSALDIATELVGEDAQREQWKASIPVGNSGFIRLRAIQ